MHNAESESKIVAGLWMLLKGQSGKITLWVSSFIIGKDILSIKSGSSLSGVMYSTPRSQNCLTLRLNISKKAKQNEKHSVQIRQGPRWARIMKKQG